MYVTSRTNDKIWVFENRLGRKIMLITLQDAKEKYRFWLANFCVMPTHVHFLIEPGKSGTLSRIMQWIKTNSTKCWNRIHGSKDHLWGDRYFSRAVRNPQEYEFVMDYIDRNLVVVGLAETLTAWKASGAYYRDRGIAGLVDFDRQEAAKQPYIPDEIAKLIPPKQLEHTLRYYGAYAEAIDNLCRIVTAMPRTGEVGKAIEQTVYLHYYTDTADYFISGYDGEDAMYGTAHSSVFPDGTERQKISLANLKKNEFMKLDFSWEGQTPRSGDTWKR